MKTDFHIPPRAPAPIAIMAALALAGALSACAGPGKQVPGEAAADDGARYAEAINHYRQMLGEKPGEIEAHIGLARNLRWAGQVDDAGRVMENSQVRFGNDGRWLAELGKVRISQGRALDGVAALSQAAEKTPGDWRIHSALGIGNDYLANYPEALAAYGRALELCPDDPAVMNNMAISQGLAGNIDRAIITLESALAYGRHSDKISHNLKVFRDARDLCSDCGSKYLMDAKSGILAAGLLGTDAPSPCNPGDEFAVATDEMTEKLSQEESINIRVYFEFDSAILRPEAKVTLNDLADALLSDELKDYRFELAGHTDAVGSEQYNLELSRKRARAVLDYLVTEFGIDATRLDTSGYGESRPLDPADPEGDINRRVQVIRLGRD